MFRPAIQKLSVLILMSIFCVAMAFFSIYFKTTEYKEGYEQKKNAVDIMSGALEALKDEADRIFDARRPQVNDIALDPLNSGLVFYCDDSEGKISSKLSVLNPNFAALVVDLFLEAGLEEGDDIAVAFTGSLPGANIAVLSACEAMGVNPTIITSISASNWGACDYKRFSWLDMENELSVFFKHKRYESIAASVGKGGDYGNYLQQKTIDEIEKKIRQYLPGDNISNNRKNLDYHIDERMAYYLGNDNKEIKLYVNVGGGVASVGTYPGIKERTGLLSVDSLKILKQDKIINGNSVMARMSINNDIPALNIVSIDQLIQNKLNVIDVGGKEGQVEVDSEKSLIDETRIFSEQKYNLLIVVPCLIISLLLVLSVGFYSHFQIKKRMRSYEPDSIS